MKEQSQNIKESVQHPTDKAKEELKFNILTSALFYRNIGAFNKSKINRVYSKLVE